MSADRPDHTADSEQPREGGFGAGEAAPEEFPEAEHVGRFSDGQEELSEEDPEEHTQGRFSEGQEEIGEEDPEKHTQGRFSEGQEE